MIGELWSELQTRTPHPGWEMKESKPPVTDTGLVITCRKLCHQNKCKTYGKNWGCPPGSGEPEDIAGEINHHRNACIIYKRFVHDLSDMDFVDECSKELQSMCRDLANELRKNGYEDVLPLADGGCKYCDVCSYPEKCASPEMMVPSVSGFGIIMEDYLASNGIEFKFEEDAFTLFGIVLY